MVVIPQDWSDEDRAWLQQAVTPDFQSIAIQYGRTIYALVMKAWTIANALHVLQEAAQGNPTLLDRVSIIQASVNDLYEALMASRGLTGEQFVECQRDIQRRAFLLQGGMGKLAFGPPANDTNSNHSHSMKHGPILRLSTSE